MYRSCSYLHHSLFNISLFWQNRLSVRKLNGLFPYTFFTSLPLLCGCICVLMWLPTFFTPGSLLHLLSIYSSAPVLRTSIHCQIPAWFITLQGSAQDVPASATRLVSYVVCTQPPLSQLSTTISFSVLQSPLSLNPGPPQPLNPTVFHDWATNSITNLSQQIMQKWTFGHDVLTPCQWNIYTVLYSLYTVHSVSCKSLEAPRAKIDLRRCITSFIRDKKTYIDIVVFSAGCVCNHSPLLI